MNNPVRVNVKSYVPGGKRDLVSKYNLTKEKIDKYIKDCLHDSCVIIRRYARTHHKYKDNPARQKAENFTGLTRAIKFHVLDKAKRATVRAGERYTAEVYIDENEAPYAKYQVEGTKAHGPVVAPRLRFFDYRVKSFNGMYPLVSRTWVRGIEKDEFLQKARRVNRAKIKEIFAEGLRRLING